MMISRQNNIARELKKPEIYIIKNRPVSQLYTALDSVFTRQSFFSIFFINHTHNITHFS